jgi:hypothetical protein
MHKNRRMRHPRVAYPDKTVGTYGHPPKAAFSVFSVPFKL